MASKRRVRSRKRSIIKRKTRNKRRTGNKRRTRNKGRTGTKNKRRTILNILNKKNFKKKHLTFFINFLIKKKIIVTIIKYNRNWYEFDNYTDLLNYKTFK